MPSSWQNLIIFFKIVQMEYVCVVLYDTPSILAVNLWVTAEKSFL